MTEVPDIRILDDLQPGDEFSITQNVKQPAYEIYTPDSYDIWHHKLLCKNRAGVGRYFDPFIPVFVVKESDRK